MATNRLILGQSSPPSTPVLRLLSCKSSPPSTPVLQLLVHNHFNHVVSWKFTVIVPTPWKRIRFGTWHCYHHQLVLFSTTNKWTKILSKGCSHMLSQVEAYVQKQIMRVVTKSWRVIVLQEDFHICDVREPEFSHAWSRCQIILIYITNKEIKYFRCNKFLLLLFCCHFSNVHQVVSGPGIMSSVVFNQDAH